MSVARACRPCRAAKERCDRVRPVCGRCQQRGLTCTGFPDAEFIFRDENEVAQRNSERARREAGEGQLSAISFEILPPQATRGQQIQASTDTYDQDLPFEYPWLKSQSIAEILDAVKNDLETRAVDRFFVNWTLYPCNDGVSPGHMHDLQALYLTAPPDSLLWLAVRAVACADMKQDGVGDAAFRIKAWQYYGAALNRLRAAAHDEHGLADDRVLAAILLIDIFEVMYLARIEPLGPHRDIIRHVILTRGNEFIFNSSPFGLWCVAHKRLQARQILLREEPDPEQVLFLEKLNANRPDIHMSVDIIHMNVLSASVKKLIESSGHVGSARMETVGQADEMVLRVDHLLALIQDWTSAISGSWKPRPEDAQHIGQPLEAETPFDRPMPHFPYPQMLNHHDAWSAYHWNLHAASQIVLRESLIELIEYSASIQEEELDEEHVGRVQAEQGAVDSLSSLIVESYPWLLGFTQRHDPERCSPPQGKMAARFFSLLPMWVVQKARFTSLLHKQTATEVVEWITSRHRLG